MGNKIEKNHEQHINVNKTAFMYIYAGASRDVTCRITR